MRRTLMTLVCLSVLGAVLGLAWARAGLNPLSQPDLAGAQAGESLERAHGTSDERSPQLGRGAEPRALQSAEAALAQVESSLAEGAVISSSVVRPITRKGLDEWTGTARNWDRAAERGIFPDDEVWLVGIEVQGGLAESDVHGFADHGGRYDGAWVALLASDGSRFAFRMFDDDEVLSEITSLPDLLGTLEGQDASAATMP